MSPAYLIVFRAEPHIIMSITAKLVQIWAEEKAEDERIAREKAETERLVKIPAVAKTE